MKIISALWFVMITMTFGLPIPEIRENPGLEGFETPPRRNPPQIDEERIREFERAAQENRRRIRNMQHGMPFMPELMDEVPPARRMPELMDEPAVPPRVNRDLPRPIRLFEDANAANGANGNNIAHNGPVHRMPVNGNPETPPRAAVFRGRQVTPGSVTPRPILISSSPETSKIKGALSVIELSSDDATLTQQSTTARILEIDSSDNDEQLILDIQKRRIERAQDLDLSDEDLSLIRFHERNDGTCNDASRLDKEIMTVDNDKELERQRKKMAKKAHQDAQRNAKKVNQKRSKAVTAQEMVVGISTDLMARNGDELVALLQEIEVECSYTSNPLPYSIMTSRKVDRTWDPDNGCWVSTPIKVEKETFIILQMDAFEFADIVKNGLKRHHERIKTIVPGYKIIYIIEDLDAYYGEIRNRRNQMMVESMNQGENSIRISKKAQERKKLLESLPDKASIEKELLWLQMQSKGDTFVHHSKQNETASWIKTFIIEIGHIPEWKSRNEESFDIQFGDSIKSGKDLKQTWQRMLECLPSMTESRAIAILEKYPTFSSLYSSYVSISESEGQNLLTNINWNSGTTSQPNLRNIGKMTSKRIYDSIMLKAPETKVMR